MIELLGGSLCAPISKPHSSAPNHTPIKPTLQTHLFGIDDYNNITTISIGAIRWLVLAFEDGGNLCRQSSHCLPLSVHQMPSSLNSSSRETHCELWCIVTVEKVDIVIQTAKLGRQRRRGDLAVIEGNARSQRRHS